MRSGRPVIIVHFQPLELYPPVMNLLRYIEENYQQCSIEVITTGKPVNSLPEFRFTGTNCRIRRFGKFYGQQFFAWRLFNYFIFYLLAFCRMVIARPAEILYYETMSSLPVYLYRKYINRSSRVFIHYHEYTSKEEYAQGMKLARIFHQKESFLYKIAEWVSHTNRDRIRLFQQDEGIADDRRFHELPNYPPQSWQAIPAPAEKPPVKFVYTGALGMDTMYTRQFANWVMQQQGRVRWDIYSGNVSPDAMAFFKQLNTDCISLKEGVDYYSLPGVLKQYQAGVILYNGHIPNYVYNAPNKLFEYICCGLDCWVPEGMEGCRPYYTSNTYPKVIPVDFQKPGSLDYNKLLNRQGSQYRPSPYYYEQVYKVICDQLFDKG